MAASTTESTTESILEKADEIGQLIADHDAAKKLETALGKLEKDTAAQQALGAYNQLLQALSQKEMSGQPIEVDDKRKLEALQTEVIHNLSLREFQMAQMDYVDLMRKVDERITGPAQKAATATLGRDEASQAAASPLAGPGMGL